MKTKKYTEDAPTNATGSAVVGTGDDVADWKPKKKKKKKVLKRLKGTYEVGRMPDKELNIEASERDMINLRLKGMSEKEIIKLRVQFYKLTTAAMKQMPGSPAQKKIIKQIETIRKKLKMDEMKENTEIATPEPDSVFAQMPVFKVSPDDFSKCKDIKKRYERWSKHIDTESDYGKKIHTYAKKNPKKSIIVQDDKSGHMVYLKKYSQVEKDK